MVVKYLPEKKGVFHDDSDSEEFMGQVWFWSIIANFAPNVNSPSDVKGMPSYPV